MRLNDRTVASLSRQVARPAYDRAGVTPGIVHLGVGGFHRAHLAVYVDDLLAGGATDWGIVGVGLLPGDAAVRDALQPQDGLYTLVVKHADGRREARVIGSLLRYLFAPDDPAAVHEALCDPAVRIVSLTITEGGYTVPAEPDPASAFGYVVAALAARRARGISPFTVMSCDNLEHNGAVTKAACTGYARLTDAGLAEWIEAAVSFPDAMVDRITPVTVDADRAALQQDSGIEDAWPVVCEPFRQWVVADAFGAGRPEWDAVGAQLVTDVEPYELMKLRLLNAGHQALAHLARLLGHDLVHDAARDPLLAGLLRGYLQREGIPAVPAVPGVDLPAYAEQLVERFANPHVRDTVARLRADAGVRIPRWLLPVVRANIDGGEIHRSALVVAAWARCLEGTDEQGREIDIAERREYGDLARDPDPFAFVERSGLFGDLASAPRFRESYARARASLRERGVRATLDAL